MSGPYGPPPGAAPQGPPQGWNPAAVGPPAARFGLDKILSLVVAGLGVVILFISLLDASSAARSLSFALGFGWAPALYLSAGLLALGAVLPKTGATTFAAAVVSLSTTLALLFTLFGATGPGPGFIVTLILGFLQAAAAVAGYLFSGGIIRMTPKPPSYGGYPPGYPGQGYGPPPGYGQQPPPSAPPGPGQNPGQYGPPPGGPQGYPGSPQ
jgi:hypothetical protein